MDPDPTLVCAGSEFRTIANGQELLGSEMSLLLIDLVPQLD